VYEAVEKFNKARIGFIIKLPVPNYDDRPAASFFAP
jgi:hypothetical protein